MDHPGDPQDFWSQIAKLIFVYKVMAKSSFFSKKLTFYVWILWGATSSLHPRVPGLSSKNSTLCFQNWIKNTKSCFLGHEVIFRPSNQPSKLIKFSDFAVYSLCIHGFFPTLKVYLKNLQSPHEHKNSTLCFQNRFKNTKKLFCCSWSFCAHIGIFEKSPILL